MLNYFLISGNFNSTFSLWSILNLGKSSFESPPQARSLSTSSKHVECWKQFCFLKAKMNSAVKPQDNCSLRTSTLVYEAPGAVGGCLLTKLCALRHWLWISSSAPKSPACCSQLSTTHNADLLSKAEWLHTQISTHTPTLSESIQFSNLCCSHDNYAALSCRFLGISRKSGHQTGARDATNNNRVSFIFISFSRTFNTCTILRAMNNSLMISGHRFRLRVWWSFVLSCGRLMKHSIILRCKKNNLFRLVSLWTHKFSFLSAAEAILNKFRGCDEGYFMFFSDLWIVLFLKIVTFLWLQKIVFFLLHNLS